MSRVFVIGRSGRMGQRIEHYCQLHGHDIVGGLSSKESKFPKDIDFDIIIDFSLPEVFDQCYQFIASSNKPYLSGITGLSENQMMMLQQLGEKIPVLYSRNYSIGIYLLRQTLRQLSKKITPDMTVSISEHHHKNKKDRPSGTAIALAEDISNQDMGIDKIQIDSIRGGQIIGDHKIEVILENEVIELNHRALNRDIFAEGAVKQIPKLISKNNGFYSMDDIMKDEI